MDESAEKNIQQLAEFIGSLADIAGAAGGSLLGALTGDPIVVAAGAVVGTSFAKAVQMSANEFAYRQLSQREKYRVGNGLIFALSKIVELLENGKSPRVDDFFDEDVTGRSPSQEILEGTLIKCKNEPEEKKVKYIGNIFANVAFMPEVLPAGANWVLQKAEELTFRQLCILSLIKEKGADGASWGPRDGDPAFEMEYKTLETMFVRDSSTEAIKTFETTGEGRNITGLSRIGEFCYTLMSLDEILDADLINLAPRFPRVFKED